MKMSAPKPLGLDYLSVVEIVETIAKKTAIRTLSSFEPLVAGMGGRVERVAATQWRDKDANFVEVRGPRDFTIYLASEAVTLDRMLLACALGHYILHTKEGGAPTAFPRFAKDATSLEGLWFGMAVVIADAPFRLAQTRASFDDALVADLFKTPVELIALKRKLIASADAARSSRVAA